MLNVGIIGLGVGEQHIAGYEAHSGCRVKGIADFSVEKKQYFKEKYPELPFFTSANDILQNPDIDVVSIASYDNYHCEQIIAAFKHDKHVFVEKPLCLSETELRSIINVVKTKPRLKLSSNLILRKCPRFQELRQWILERKLGKIYYVEGDYNFGRIHKITEGWRGKIDFYSVLYGGGIHLIDLLLWITGDHIEEVTAFGNNICTQGTQFQYNDLVASLLKFKSGAIGKVTANFGCVFPHFHCLNIYGTKATWLNGLNEARMYTSRDKSQIPEIIVTPYPGVHKGDLLYNFIESILFDLEPEISCDEIFTAMSVCLSIEKAMQQNSTIKVEYIN